MWVLPKFESVLASGLSKFRKADELESGSGGAQHGNTQVQKDNGTSSAANTGPTSQVHAIDATTGVVQQCPASTDAGVTRQTNIILGSALLWLEWFEFKGGSALGANLRAVSACMCTHLAACSGGVTFLLMSAVVEYIWPEENSERPAGGNPNSIKFSLIDLCPGDVIGIVCMIPAAGFIPHQVAPVVGVVGAAIIFGVVQTPLDEIVTDMHCIFSVHGGGGLVDTV